MSKFRASSSPMLGQRQHAIYGLYLSAASDVVLYAGSWRVATLDERLRQHRAGECRTTAKMAARQGLDTNFLRMRVLAYWMSGVEASPEGKVILGLQARGQCRWNHPYTMSTKDCQQGAYSMHATWGRTDEAHEIWVRIGRIGGYKGNREGKARGGHIGGLIGGLIGGHLGNHEAKVQGGHIGGCRAAEGWGRTPEAQEQRIRAGRIGSSKTFHEEHVRGAHIGNCTRWHSGRPKVDRLCAQCTANSLHD